MNLVPIAVSKKVFRSALVLKKNSPNIMFAGGLAGVVASTILACRATLKLAEELPVMRQDLDACRTEIEDPEAQKKALALVYTVNASKVVKMYAPAVVVGGLSIGALTGSHVQLTRRNAGLTALYAAVNKSYEEYRERARNVIGEEKELELYRSVEENQITLPDGKKIKAKTIPAGMSSPYARLFDVSTSTAWQKEPQFNLIYIKCQEDYATRLLRQRGHVMLNDVYDVLGLERTSEGAIVGWVDDDEVGDGYIDFGLHQPGNEQFLAGRERSVWLDFNVDGPVYDLISKNNRNR